MIALLEHEFVEKKKYLEKKLSFINNDIDLTFGDTFLTLIADSNEFKGAKNVVIARKVRAYETTYTNTNHFSVNRNRELPSK